MFTFFSRYPVDELVRLLKKWFCRAGRKKQRRLQALLADEAKKACEQAPKRKKVKFDLRDLRCV